MDFLQAIILSAVEGTSEFLPISSTGHLILASDILQVPQTDFVKSFEIAIQLGAIFSVVVLYFSSLKNITVWKKVLIAFLPTAVLGLIFYKIIKTFLLGNVLVTLSALFLGGIALIFFEMIYKEREHHINSLEEISSKQAFLIGVFQSISMIPGVSRSAATILGGLSLGLKRQAAAEFSFLLAIPTMLAATVLDLVKSKFAFSPYEYSLLAIGFVGSFIVALFVVKLFLQYLKNHSFVVFGIYRIVLAASFWFLIVT